MGNKPQNHDGFVCVSMEAAPGSGEDSFVGKLGKGHGFLCVADGCGGLGAKRYGNLGDHTGAYWAARLATEHLERKFWDEKPVFPQTKEQGKELCEALAQALAEKLKNFEAEHKTDRNIRIVGSMQRTLPTTLCATLFQAGLLNTMDCLFLWAGDSRGYILNTGGLHQLTADHTAMAGDAMEGLYCDAPLQNMVNGDKPFFISARRIRVKNPCLILIATDGAFSYLPTPMEFEWLLLSSLKLAKTMQAWQKRIEKVIGYVTGDDATLLMAVNGYGDFEALKASFEKRCEELQRDYITPVRRRRSRKIYATGKWEEYRKSYDWMDGQVHGELDWRI